MAAIDFMYKKAIGQLNSLQTNAETIKKTCEQRQEITNCKLKETKFYLNALGITEDKLDALNPIHVSGTKGKGSTCAFTESLLRNLGVRTGFYSSPHLVHVRERIRINGVPISKELFSRRFFEVYEKVHSLANIKNVSMPGYFKFLTIMAFYIFVEEKVDAIIVEVGIGGENDCTNIIRTPIVCGITVLDLDHTSLLGQTISEIAWHKAGIMKANRPCFSVTQPFEAWEVFKTRAKEKSATIEICRSFEDYKWPQHAIKQISNFGQHQKLNISLALQLAKTWLWETKLDFLTEKDCNGKVIVPKSVEKSILTTHWPGRNQILKKGNLTYYLDGAHTRKSIECCMDWLKSVDNENDAIKLLLFHCTGNRDASTLLSIIMAKGYPFNKAIFCPTKLMHYLDLENDNTNLTKSIDEQWEKCIKSKSIWNSLTENNNGETFECIKEAIDYIHQLAENNTKVNILVTGSLHLVGGVLYFEDAEYEK